VKVRVLLVFAVLFTVVVVAALVFTGRSMLTQRNARASERTPLSAIVIQAPARTVGVVSDDFPAFVTRCGCRPNVGVEYVNVGTPVRATISHEMLRDGATPLLEIVPSRASLRGVAGGTWDPWLRKWALMVRRQRVRFLMSFAPEANGHWNAWGWPHVRPATEVAAWRHVVAVFRAAGASNTSWVWIVNTVCNGTGPLKRLWPGAAYVDEVGIDGYYTTATDTFASVYLPALRRIRRITNEPVFISEAGANHIAGKVRALKSLTAGIAHYHLRGFVWFDINKPGLRQGEPQDFAVSDDKAALGAYKAALRRSYGGR
jgi:Glycosyl hydrolase family 26